MTGDFTLKMGPVADPGFYIGGCYIEERAQNVRENFEATPIFALAVPTFDLRWRFCAVCRV